MKFVTSSLEGGRSLITLQRVLIGCNLDTSLQQKKTLLYPLYFSNTHLRYSSASEDSLSASWRTITTNIGVHKNIESHHHLVLRCLHSRTEINVTLTVIKIGF